MNYHNKKFKVISNSEHGEVSDEVIFNYQQDANVLTCSYSGVKIKSGHLIGIVDKGGNIDMCYHQVNTKGELLAGVCSSKPEILSNGKIRLHESWQWTSGDKSKGTSVLEEV